MRVELSQELVIGGYTSGTHGFDAVQIGFYRDDRLYFCASVRAGFVPVGRRAIHAQLASLEAAACPFVNLRDQRRTMGTGPDGRKNEEVRMLRPKAVVSGVDPNDHLRHASFVPLRDDKDPRAVVKEDETTTERKALR